MSKAPRTLRHETPAGTLTTIVDDDVVLAAGFTPDAAELTTRLGLPDAPPAMDGGIVDAAVRAYLAGDVTALDDVALRQPGTAFQQQVWNALRTVPPGETATYKELAHQVGRPGATRAVGSACGRNLIAPFVPCHRAIRTDGSMGGYYYGLEVKDWLLRHETGQS